MSIETIGILTLLVDISIFVLLAVWFIWEVGNDLDGTDDF